MQVLLEAGCTRRTAIHATRLPHLMAICGVEFYLPSPIPAVKKLDQRTTSITIGRTQVIMFSRDMHEWPRGSI
ncbi:hypothetical protein SCLCIDRAFT_1213917, partial [Scleroderma citrinum Foug A]